MKKIILFLFIAVNILFAQNATQFLPVKLGNNWFKNVQALDTLNNPTGPIAISRMVSVAYTNFLGKQTLICLTGTQGSAGIDTNWLAPEGTNVFVHQPRVNFDSVTIGGSLPDWLQMYRFASTINLQYTVYTFDTTLVIDSITLPLRITLRGKRLTNETVTVPAGTYNNCMKFTLGILFQYRLTFPLPPVTLFEVTEDSWIADSTWIVKTIRPTVNQVIPIVNQRILIPGSKSELIYFGPYFCDPVVNAEGWNLVSVPYHSNNMSKTNLFPAATSQAFEYNNGYIAADTLKNGTGYWLKFASPGFQNICGIKYPSNSVPVKQGWNLIGPYEKIVAVSNITSTPPGIINSAFFGYLNGYQVADSLRPGKGYWVKVLQNGTLGTGNMTMKYNDRVNEEIEKFPFIRIRDNSGKTYTLYLSDRKLDYEKFELPPVPPTGIFDVRFSSGHYVENMKSSNNLVEINSAQYPVEIESSADLYIRDNYGGNIMNRMICAGEKIIIDNPLLNKLIIFNSDVPYDFSLEQNYPNPFNPTTTFSYSLKEPGFVLLKVYSFLGEEMIVENKYKEAGYYKSEFNAQNFSSGIYFYEINIKGYDGKTKFRDLKKMILLK